jgi:hypothetical protein
VCILVGLKYNRTFVDVDEALECATYIDTWVPRYAWFLRPRDKLFFRKLLVS